jgi:hypothetical protein
MSQGKAVAWVVRIISMGAIVNSVTVLKIRIFELSSFEILEHNFLVSKFYVLPSTFIWFKIIRCLKFVVLNI